MLWFTTVCFNHVIGMNSYINTHTYTHSHTLIYFMIIVIIMSSFSFMSSDFEITHSQHSSSVFFFFFLISFVERCFLRLPLYILPTL